MKRCRKSSDTSESGLSSHHLTGISWLSNLFSATAAFIDEYGFEGRLIGLYYSISFHSLFRFHLLFGHCYRSQFFSLNCLSYPVVCFLLLSSLSYPAYFIFLFPVDMLFISHNTSSGAPSPWWRRLFLGIWYHLWNLPLTSSSSEICAFPFLLLRPLHFAEVV